MSARASRTERAAGLPGDDVVPDADVVMDTAFDLPAPPAAVWPWFVQLGKRRGGYYLPRWVEAVTPRARRGLRHLDDDLLGLQVGDTIPDWGGREATFTAHEMTPPHTLVHRSTRDHVRLSWAIVLRAQGPGTRVQLRLRLAGVRHRTTARVLGGAADRLTVEGLAVGLRERLTSASGTDPAGSPGGEDDGRMATVSRHVDAPPTAVWDVLADGWSYSNWVVGASHMRAVEAAWPAAGSKLHHSQGSWPVTLDDEAVVEVSKPASRLVLLAKGRPLGSARVQLDLRSEDGGTRVTMTETPVSGPGKLLDNPLADVVLARRNTEALARLAAMAERRTTPGA
ncbi:Polyketide cyclase / dehydrase and lipid transport [Klenkia soli]|uniref:Polyketide cyclase / dehydrase and lipid transport n=1 Tax=Klenkia soli TaxID=1052260 RepID=A0A1H0P8M9_9ACTN|nr:SRPBCC family protein [Klenkia soli]SDP01467.1 Polyketide cyclase / dehydrase and lipid transport [Klenkia soli]